MDDITGADIKQFVVFRLGKEEYGLDIQRVTTIEKIMTITRVPKTPECIKGVINLRGEIIPVMDIRIKFNLPVAEETDDTRIIIVKTEDIAVGVIVDSVAEVLNLTEDSIEGITNFSSVMDVDYIYGVGKSDGRIVTLLYVDKLIKISD